MSLTAVIAVVVVTAVCWCGIGILIGLHRPPSLTPAPTGNSRTPTPGEPEHR